MRTQQPASSPRGTARLQLLADCSRAVGTHNTPALRLPDPGRDGLPTTLPPPAEDAETELVPMLDSWQGGVGGGSGGERVTVLL